MSFFFFNTLYAAQSSDANDAVHEGIDDVVVGGGGGGGVCGHLWFCKTALNC